MSRNPKTKAPSLYIRQGVTRGNKLHGTSNQVYQDELLHRHPKSNKVFAKTTIPLRVENDKLYFFICFFS